MATTLAAACNGGAARSPGEPAAAARAPSFELACAASNTAATAAIFCVRTDTRNGDLLNVNYLALPPTNGSTKVSDNPPGRFTTVCTATSTTNHSDFYCVRMNTETGDMVLVNLQKLNAIPSLTPPMPIASPGDNGSLSTNGAAH